MTEQHAYMLCLRKIIAGRIAVQRVTYVSNGNMFYHLSQFVLTTAVSKEIWICYKFYNWRELWFTSVKMTQDSFQTDPVVLPTMFGDVLTEAVYAHCSASDLGVTVTIRDAKSND